MATACLALLLAAGSFAFAASESLSAAPSSPPGTPPAGPQPSSAANLPRARSEATALLALARLPAGANPSRQEPSGDHRVLAEPGYDAATPNLVEAHAWWTIHARPDAVLAYVRAHLPPDATASSTSSGNVAPGFASDTYQLPPIAGILSERVVAVAVVRLPDGVTAVRTDGEAVWITPRPAWELIPAHVDTVTFTARGATASGVAGRQPLAR